MVQAGEEEGEENELEMAKLSTIYIAYYTLRRITNLSAHFSDHASFLLGLYGINVCQAKEVIKKKRRNKKITSVFNLLN
jgi:hypothetical protein